MSPFELRRYRAERLLRKDFAALRSKVLAIVRSQLRGRGIRLDLADLEACYALAWQGLYAAVLDEQTIENPSAWLVLVTYRRAIDEHRSASRVGVVEGEDIGSFSWRNGSSVEDIAAELDDRERLRQVFEGLRARLSPRECEAASLCYLQGLSRADAAERMGISEARMRKLMEGAGAGRLGVAGKVGDLLATIEAGGWCEQQSSLMKAYAFGILDREGQRYALAVVHLRECPACRAHVASLRGLASVLPLPLLPLAFAGGTVGAGAAGGATGSVTAGARGAGDAASSTTAGGAGTGGSFAAGAGRAFTSVGRKALGSAWSSLSGSLAAKLAVTAIAVLGAGYAVLGARAHGSPGGSSAPAALTPSPIATDARSHPLFALPLAPTPAPALASTRARARAGRPNRRAATSRSSRPPATSAHGAAHAAEVPAHEFSPERVSALPAVPATQGVAPLTSASARPTSGEFGLE